MITIIAVVDGRTGETSASIEIESGLAAGTGGSVVAVETQGAAELVGSELEASITLGTEEVSIIGHTILNIEIPT